MDVRVLLAFVTVANRRSFTVAADELFLTQSAVSQQIRSLETELGTSLFVRGRSQTDLTAAGRALIPRAQQMLALAEEMKLHFADTARIGGRLRIVAATVASSYLYVGLYERFARQHPEVSLEIVTGIGAAAVEQVERGEADAAFVQFPVDGTGLEYDVLGETEVVLVTAGNAPEVVNLERQPLLVWSGSRELERLLAGRSDLRVAARTNDLALLKRLIDARLGCAFMPRWAVGSELETAALRLVAAPFPVIRHRFGVTYRGGERSSTQEAFLNAAREYRRVILELCR